MNTSAYLREECQNIFHMVHNINDRYIQAERLCVFFNYEIHIVKIHTPEDQVGSSDD